MGWPADHATTPDGDCARAAVTASPRRLAPGVAIACGYAGLLLVACFGTAPWLGLFAGLALTALVFLPGLRRAEPGSIAAGLLAGTVFVLLCHDGAPRGWLDGLPVLINLALAMLFGCSLAAGREPLIACAIRAVEGPARLAMPGVATYARGLTVFWTLLCAAQAVCAIAVLAFRPAGWLDAAGLDAGALARPAGWDTALHFGSLAVVVVAFLGEYGFRRCWLRHVPHVSLPVFIVRLVRAWPAVVQAARTGTPA